MANRRHKSSFQFRKSNNSAIMKNRITSQIPEPSQMVPRAIPRRKAREIGNINFIHSYIPARNAQIAYAIPAAKAPRKSVCSPEKNVEPGVKYHFTIPIRKNAKPVIKQES